MTNPEITPFPRPSWFMASGIRVLEMMEIERRWPVLTEEERQKVVRRVVPLRDVELDDILK